MDLRFSLERIRLVKDVLLGFSVAYFYLLGFALLFSLPTFGVEALPLFFGMSLIFLVAVFLEAMLAWWSKRRFVLFGALGVVTYGVIGLYLAPSLYGGWVQTYVLLEPLIVVFLGGFAFLFGKSLAEAFIPEPPLGAESLATALKELPGWKADVAQLEKTFAFTEENRARIFVHAVEALGDKKHYTLRLHADGDDVSVRLSAFSKNGITRREVEMAHDIDTL